MKNRGGALGAGPGFAVLPPKNGVAVLLRGRPLDDDAAIIDHHRAVAGGGARRRARRSF